MGIASWVVQVFSRLSSLPMSQTAGSVSSLRPETDSGIRKVMVMRLIVAGGTGVVGRRPPRATPEGATR
jgi:hypothetical protein